MGIVSHKIYIVSPVNLFNNMFFSWHNTTGFIGGYKRAIIPVVLW
jgi:hypothetical protein